MNKANDLGERFRRTITDLRGTKPIKANDFIFGLEANDLGERFRRTKPIWADDLGERNRFRRTIFKANDRSPRQFFKANEISFALANTISKPVRYN